MHAQLKSQKNKCRPSTLKCQSPFHNEKSNAIHSFIFNFTYCWETEDLDGSFQNVTIIPQGTITYNYALRCDGFTECSGSIDELNCGFNTFGTIFTGNHFLIIHFCMIVHRFQNISVLTIIYPMTLIQHYNCCFL